MNNINLIGRITKDLELRQTTSGQAVCEFSLAVNRTRQEGVDFINVTVWGKQAENLTKYQGKGSLIAVSGSLRVDKYENKEGEKRNKTYVLANSIEYLGARTSETVNNTVTAETLKEEFNDPFKYYQDTITIDDSFLD